MVRNKEMTNITKVIDTGRRYGNFPNKESKKKVQNVIF